MPGMIAQSAELRAGRRAWAYPALRNARESRGLVAVGVGSISAGWPSRGRDGWLAAAAGRDAAGRAAGRSNGRVGAGAGGGAAGDAYRLGAGEPAGSLAPGTGRTSRSSQCRGGLSSSACLRQRLPAEYADASASGPSQTMRRSPSNVNVAVAGALHPGRAHKRGMQRRYRTRRASPRHDRSLRPLVFLVTRR